jgi:hypothetical protein
MSVTLCGSFIANRREESARELFVQKLLEVFGGLLIDYRKIMVKVVED